MARTKQLLTLDFKQQLYPQNVQRYVERQKRQVMFRTGGFTRTAMKRGMRKKSASKVVQIPRARKPGATGGSIPPKPPRYGRDRGIKDHIEFAVDLQQEIVNVGPMYGRTIEGSTITIPQLLNQGGVQTVQLPNAIPEDPLPAIRAEYDPRPFATADSPAFVAGQKFMREQLTKREIV